MIDRIIGGIGSAIGAVVQAAKRTPEQIAAAQRARALTRSQRAFHRALRKGDPDAINAAKQALDELGRE